MGWWLACILGAGVVVYLLWGSRPTALAWPEAALIALGLVVSAGPMISELEFTSAGLKLKSVQAAAEVARKSSELAAENDRRLVDLEKKVSALTAANEALKSSADAATRSKVEAAAKSPPELSAAEKAAQEAAQKLQRDIKSIIQVNPKVFSPKS